jgi:hypothetical protein
MSNVHYVSVLAYNSGDPNPVGVRVEWLRPMIEAKLPLTLFIDARYQDALNATEWYSGAIHPDLNLVPWYIGDSDVWSMCMKYSPTGSLELPESRNVAKDSEFFLGLMNMKTEFVARAARSWGEGKYVAFLDAGIAKIFKDVEGSFRRLRELRIREDVSGVVIPGCWAPRPLGVEELSRKICWMYCGGFFLVGRKEAAAFDLFARMALKEFLREGRITWEVNVWVRLLEMPEAPKLHWFAADHNDRMTMVPDEFLAPIEIEVNPPGSDEPSALE